VAPSIDDQTGHTTTEAATRCWSYRGGC
jgi:hypothetical protein